MATSFQLDCPHCRSQRSSFTVVHQHFLRDDGRDVVITSVCGVCDFPVLIHYRDSYVGIRTNSAIDIKKEAVDFSNPRFLMLEVWPESIKLAPDDLPSNVEKFFNQGLRNERVGDWDAAGAMFRKSLDVATKLLDPSLANETLFKRINKLQSQGRITDDLAAWAHEVRIDGNSSVHDDTPETKDDVSAIHEFASAFLLYTFTLPALIAARSSAPEESLQESL